MHLGLSGRSILVTGASRGIGRAIAEVFAREGCRLHLVARNAAELALVEDDLKQRYGAEIFIDSFDVGATGAVAEICAWCPDADVVINNAGAIPQGDLLAMDEEIWRAGWELKVFGYINMTRAFYRRMCQRGHGVIINIIGISAEKLDYGYVAGSTGNAALAAFTRTVGSFSMDFGVRVLGVSPGWVETDRATNSLRRRSSELLGSPDRWRELVADKPAGRLISPEEVANVICFLASDAASAICGHVYTVDGGFSARSYPRMTTVKSAACEPSTSST